MIFHAEYHYSEADRDRGHARFLETGAPPPPEVRMVGRWHDVAGNRGFLVAETDDAAALARWLHRWTDLVAFEVAAVRTTPGSPASSARGHIGRDARARPS